MGKLRPILYNDEIKSLVYVYLRVSTDRQEVENQMSGVLNFCSKRELKPNYIIKEHQSGAKSVSSRKLGSVLKRMKKGDTLVVSEISRLSRNLLDLMELLKQALEKEIKILTVKEGYELGNNINSKVLAFAFGLAAEIERTLISQRIKEALQRKRGEGMVLGRPKGSKKKNPILLRHSDKIFSMYSAGEKQSAIAKRFNVHRHTVKDFIKNHIQHAGI